MISLPAVLLPHQALVWWLKHPLLLPLLLLLLCLMSLCCWVQDLLHWH
jgi:hypothetical protein